VQFYCPQALANSNQRIWIREKMLEFSSTVLSTLSPSCYINISQINYKKRFKVTTPITAITEVNLCHLSQHLQIRKRISSEQSFTAHMPLLIVTSAFRLERTLAEFSSVVLTMLNPSQTSKSSISQYFTNNISIFYK